MTFRTARILVRETDQGDALACPVCRSPNVKIVQSQHSGYLGGGKVGSAVRCECMHQHSWVIEFLNDTREERVIVTVHVVDATGDVRIAN